MHSTVVCNLPRKPVSSQIRWPNGFISNQSLCDKFLLCNVMVIKLIGPIVIVLNNRFRVNEQSFKQKIRNGPITNEHLVEITIELNLGEKEIRYYCI